MTTTRIGIGVTSVQAAKPSYAYGSTLQQVPIKSGEALALLRAAIPASIPKNAVVTSAKVWANQYDGGWSGSNTLTLLRHLAAYTYRVTWNTKPAATTSNSQSKTASAAGTWWSIDVTDNVQDFIAGSKTNYGWRLATDSTVLHKMRTHRATASQPYLEIVYELPSKVPTDLAPQGGAVAIAAPVLTFTCGDDTIAINVQVDPAADAGTAFDSDQVDATAGVLDLSQATPGGTYAGLADGDTTFWRARALSASGWSGWSQWAEFSREDLETATLTSPSSTPADGTPPFEWTFSGTQTAWQADFLDSSGKVLDSSGLVSGDDTNWTPTKGLRVSGLSGVARIRLYDDVNRIATSGQVTYAEDSVALTVAFDGTVDPMDTLAVDVTANRPGLNLTGTLSSGAPDEVVIFRDDVQIARLPGVDVFTGTAFAYIDWAAPIGASSTYRVAPVVGGRVAAGGPTASGTAHCVGIWLIEPASGLMAFLVDRDDGTWDATDVATVHMPIADGAPPVRRRLRRGVLTGAISGRVVDTVFFDAEDTLNALEVFANNDAGATYLLIAGSLNAEVIVGDILLSPTPVNGADKAQFNFWGA